MSDKVTELTADDVFTLLGGPTAEPAVTPSELEAASVDVSKLSQHNLELAQAALAGSDFRIAFKKPGEKEWTRVAGVDQTTLQAAVIKEIERRQYSLHDYLANLSRSFILGVFGY